MLGTMKYLALFSILFFSTVFGGPVIIDGEYRFLIKEVRPVDGFDYQYQFFTDHPEERLVLDCQSFIQNMKIFWKEAEYAESLVDGMLLSPGECQFIAYNVFTLRSQHKDVCLKVIPESWSIKVGGDPNECYHDGLKPDEDGSLD